jgi:uncharacterized membrane protein YccC
VPAEAGLNRFRPHPLRDLLRLEPGRPALAVGLRMAIVISVPMIIGASMGKLEPATTVCLGALNGGMADVGGARSSRWHALGGAMVLDALAIAVGTLAGQSIWAAVPIMFVVALACGLANLFGNVAANVGFVVVILYMVGVGAPGGGPVAFERLWLTLIGGAWALVVVLIIWPVRPFEAVSTGLAKSCSSLAALVRTIASPTGVAEEDRSRASASAHVVRDLLESTRSTLVLVRTGRRGESALAQRLLVELREIRRILNIVEGLGAGGPTTLDRAPSGLSPVLAGELSTVADTVEHLGESIRHMDTSPPDHSVGVGLLAGIDALEERMRTTGAGLDEVVDVDVRSSTAALLRVTVSLRTMTEALTTPSRGRPAEGVPVPARPGDASNDAGGTDGRFRRLIGLRAGIHQVGVTLRANITLDSMVARHALRYGTTTAVGLTIAMAADLTKGYWITLTIAVVLRPFVAVTVSRAVLRVSGTVLGAALTAVVVVRVTGTAELIALLFVLAVLAFSLMPLNYALGVVFLTPLVITLISLTAGGGWVLAEHRIINTLIGGALALAGGYLLWPGGGRGELVQDLEASLVADEAFFDATVAGLSQDSGSRDYSTLVSLHLQAGLALDNVVARFQQALGESAARRGPVDVLWSMTESSRAIFLATAAIEQHLHVVDRAHTERAIGAFRSEVGGHLRELTAELGRSVARRGDVRATSVAASLGPASPAGRPWAEATVIDVAGITRAAATISDALSDLRREVEEVSLLGGQGALTSEAKGHSD